ncbi:hypothetical protein BJV74DRAFT_144633 [Russula compacta]|nr:hypothetical protein BJV74DRAFT_144633 [Russula compacta]
MLSPDPQERTTVLLGQISQQLAGFQNNTYPPFQDSALFSPTTAIMWVNALWFLSLVTSIVSAFYVMLVQQWIRRYTQVIADLSGSQGRVRSSLFLGTQKYRMSHAIGLIPWPLHISVFLFFSGLIIFLFTISHTIATVVTVCVGVFGLTYFGLTIIPTIDDVCPYFTPMSDGWWYIWHSFLSASAFGLRWVLRQLHGRLKPDNMGDITSRRQHLLQWLSIMGDSTKKHGQRLKDGLRRSIIQRALDAPVTVDLKALTWLLQRPAMAEKSNVQDLVASIPETTLIQLSNVSAEPGQTTILEHLSNLLRSCTQGTVKLDENTRSRRLLACLDAFYHIVKPTGASPTQGVLSEVWTNFESIDTLRKLWADSDPAIRVTSRSICAHLARDLVRNYKSELEESESDMTWLREVMGEPATAITNSLNDPATLDHMNLKSFVYGLLSNPTGDPLAKRPICFVETLAVLMNAGSPAALSSDIFKEQLSALIQLAEHDGDQYHEVVTNLHRILSYMVAHDKQASNN